MLFHPDHKVYRTPLEDGLAYEDIYFHTKDDTRLHAWWVKPESRSKGVMLVVHGNAQNLSAHYRGWVWLVKAGYALFIFDHRGYGRSEGEPDLGSGVDDTRVALEYVSTHYTGPYFACGQSLGGVLLSDALASEAFEAYQLAIIDSAYSELEAMGRTVLSRSYLTWPFQWLAYPLLTDAYDPIDGVAAIKVPLLFIAGSQDGIIPPNNSWQLFDAATPPKEMWLVQGAGHIRALDEAVVRKALLKRMEEDGWDQEYSQMRIYKETQ